MFGESGVDAAARGGNGGFVGEVHGDDALVTLDDAVLQAGVDAEVRLARQDQRGAIFHRDVDVVVAHQAFETGDDDGGGAGEARLLGDVGLVLEAESAAVEPNAALGAPRVKLAAQRAKKAHTAVVAVLLRVRRSASRLSNAFQSYRPGSKLTRLLNICWSGTSVTSAKKF